VSGARSLAVAIALSALALAPPAWSQDEAAPAADAAGAATAFPAQAMDATRPAPLLGLAARLRTVGSHEACAVEALRHAHQHPDDPAERERGFERAALCLSFAGRFADARRLMLTLDPLGERITDQGRLRLCLTEVFLPGIGAHACDRPAGPGASRAARLAAHTPIMRALHAGRWQEARGRLTGAPNDADRDASTWLASDRAHLRRYDELPRKSPLVAGALSALVPGLGRVYLGRWQDAILSFLLVGATSGLAAHGFVHDGTSSVRGWIMGSTAAVFYVGNVYGSAVGAIVQRREREAALHDEVDRDYKQRLDP
jgi:TM2 domain-containing membrane protein YozV